MSERDKRDNGSLITREIQKLDVLIPQEHLLQPGFKRIGAILFNGGSQLYNVWSVGSALHAKHAKITDLDGITIDIESQRILALGNDDVRIGRFGLGAISFYTQQRARGAGLDYYASLTFSDLESPEIRTDDVQEVEGARLLKALIGYDDVEDGGIAEFTGDGKRKDYALVLNVPNASKVHTLVGFIYPEQGDMYGIDSMVGLFEFVKRLNRQFIQLDNNEINRIFIALDNAHDEAKKTQQSSDSDLGREICKARCAAYILLAEIYKGKGSEKYLNALYSEMEELKPYGSDVFGRVRNRLIIVAKEFPRGGIFVEDRDENQAVKPQKITLEKMQMLRKETHSQLGSDFARSKDEGVGRTLNTYYYYIKDFLLQATTKEEFDEIEELLNELKNTSYGKSWGKDFEIEPQGTLIRRVLDGTDPTEGAENIRRIKVAEQCDLLISYCRSKKIGLSWSSM